MTMCSSSLRYSQRVYTVVADGQWLIEVFDAATGMVPSPTSGVWRAAARHLQ